MYVTLNEAKKHLQIDEDFIEDDGYIIALIKVAEGAVEAHLGKPFKDCLEDGELPAPIIHSILLMVGNLYASRESVVFTSANKVPYSLDYLLGLYKLYSIF